jgi:hypothetical protein
MWVDPGTGAAWVLHAGGLDREQAGVVHHHDALDNLGTIVSGVATGDGRLFLGDGTNLLELAGEAPPTWTNDIQPIYAKHCDRCHAAAGSARPELDSAQAFRMNVDMILQVIADGSMPYDRATTVTQEEQQLIARWRDEGSDE